MAVQLDHDKLVITNTGIVPAGRPEEMFERFKTGKPSGRSQGLGLTIVKKICDVSNYTIRYRFEISKHIVEVQFSEN